MPTTRQARTRRNDGRTVTAGPGEIVHVPKGEIATIRSHEQGAVTAYVTYPHWQEAHEARARGNR
ncbi:MAG: hypothetical protein QHD01_11180 [Bradyrhizobium sp.]|uniref:hypothetical protein n=1 Tax=Bradyrhizobium sp. TaxID=376 RepID=UPI0029B8E35E|nr:hypothetical protein [Bradyrhizobium sp.]MDX3967149.1 hypothetical protein [Bradyrhizobium sp.]